MFYNDCSVDPDHPCRHPIFDATKFETEPYNPATLTSEQLEWEDKRVARRSRARIPSDDSDDHYEDEKESDVNKNKIFDRLGYKARLLPSMISHDFDGKFKECSECGSKLWGTSTIFPLSQAACSVRNPYIKTPRCIACQKLFSSVKTQQEKNDIIAWMLTGEFKGKKTHFPKDYYFNRCKGITSSMRSRMNKQTRSKKEKETIQAFEYAPKKQLQIELHKRVSSSKTWLNNQRVKAIELSFRQKSNHFKKKIAIPFRKKNVEVATRKELTELVEKRNYSDALLGWTLEVDDDRKFNFLTFDHIEPVSHVKHINGSFGIGNIQPLCQILNNIKGNYSEKELCRWLILLLNAYYRKYAPAQK